jgi:hypothetical protein
MAKPLGRREAQQRAGRLHIFRQELLERERLEPFLDKSLEELAAQHDIDTTESQPLIGLTAMHFVSQRERTLYFTGLIALVVFVSFVLNLYVLGQIFNIIPSPNAFEPWVVAQP